MSFRKRLFKHPKTIALLAWLLSLYIRLVYVTSRKTFVIDEAARPHFRGEANGVVAFWHGRMMMLPMFDPRHRKTSMLSSMHRDGLLTSKMISHFGMGVIYGSSNRGGKEAFRACLRALEAGENIGITPDGPRGPNQVAAMGVATLARLSGKAVLPITFSATCYKRFNSWDRLMLVHPFGRIVFCAGAPILVQEQDDDETARRAIEQAMNALVEKADSLVASGG